MPTVDNAISYAEAGYPIFPIWGINNGICTCSAGKNCENPGKHPITKRGVSDATTNIKQIRIWWAQHPGANIAIATGEAAGVFVLDVDGPEGFAKIKGKHIPATRSVATGKGVHYYFVHPGFKVKNYVGETFAPLGKGLDTRGDMGYVLAPPSNHISGRVYEWADELVDFAEAPDWLKLILLEGQTNFIVDESANIEKGGRNVYLASKAGSMRKAGLPFEAIRAALIELNAAKCNPPLSIEEVEKVALSISKKPYDKKEDESTLRFTIEDDSLGDKLPTNQCKEAAHTDVGNAEAFVSMYGSNFRYDHTRKKWIVWLEGSGVWREDYANAAHRAMIATIRSRNAIAASITDDGERQSLQRFCTASEKSKGIQFALDHAKTFPGLAVTTNDFDVYPSYLNFLNGTLNLDNLMFEEADRRLMISRQMATVYDPTAKAPLWEKTIHQIFDGDEDLINYVQRALGYCLSGKTNEQAFFIAHGSGANGKSTLFNVVRKIMGDYASTTAFATFDADNKNQYGNDLAALKGRRFVMAIEAEQSKRLAEARVKTVTGGEPISCRFLYGEFFEMSPEFKVWLAVNHKPLIRGADHGIWRRIHLIPFNVTFGDSGKYPMDKDLETKLADEWSGIVNWLIDGYQLWKNEGLKPPASVQEATQEYKKENDSVALWVDERCNTDTEETLPASEGYQDFRDFLTRTGETERAIPSMRVWGTLMSEKGFQKKRTAKGYEYLGIKVQPLKLTDNRGN